MDRDELHERRQRREELRRERQKQQRMTLVTLLAAAVVVICAILLIVYSSVWKYRLLHVISVSALIWTAITCAYITLCNISDLSGFWTIFLIGVPLQLLEIFWASFRSLFRRWKAGMMERRQPTRASEEATDEEKGK